METKKNRKIDLETKRTTFFLTGLAIAIAIVLSAFNFGVPVQATKLPDFKSSSGEDDHVYIQPTNSDAPIAAPPVIHSFTNINIVDNTGIPEITEIPSVIITDPTVASVISAVSTEYPKEDITEALILFPEVYPEFPGGMGSLKSWLSKNVHYPEEAEKMSISGKVFLSFEVDKNGKISNAKVVKGIDPMLDEEALRVVNAMPLWKPGLQNGRPVKVMYSFYINFKVENM